MILYNIQGEEIGTIDLRSDIKRFMSDGQVFRCAVDEKPRDYTRPERIEDVWENTYKVIGLFPYKKGVMIVEGSVDDLAYMPLDAVALLS